MSNEINREVVPARDLSLGSAVAAPKEERQDYEAVKRVELRVHTKMTRMEGLAEPEQIVARAAAWGMPAVAVTDCDAVQAFPDMSRAGKRHDVKILYGCEGYLSDDITFDYNKYRGENVILFAKNRAGLKTLYKLISASYLEPHEMEPVIPKSVLAEARGNLLLGSPCDFSELVQAIVAHADWDELLQIASFYDYLEIGPICSLWFLRLHDGPTDAEELREIYRTIVRIGDALHIPVCATGNVRFLDPEDEKCWRVLQITRINGTDRPMPLYFQTTDEMLEEFSYLGEQKAYEVVVTNTRAIAEQIGTFDLMPAQGLCLPQWPDVKRPLREIVWEKARELYGELLPPIVSDRLKAEYSGSEGKYDVIYQIAKSLVDASRDAGHPVNTRGGAAASLTAYFAGITDINPLPPHYRCPHCGMSEFVTDDPFGCGIDLPDKLCPRCGTPYTKEGFNIPFETFLGSDGASVPHIDLNFTAEYQAKAQQQLVERLGEKSVLRAGIIGTLIDWKAKKLVARYLELYPKDVSEEERKRLIQGCTGAKKRTEYLPYSYVLVPESMEIEDFCPAQHPEGGRDTELIATHFEYRDIESCLYKFSLLSNDSMTMLRRLELLTETDLNDVPLDDPDTMRMIACSAPLGFENDEILGPTGATGLPEFGSRFIRKMLMDVQPRNFGDLIKILGYSHGTDVWLGNAKELLLGGTASVRETIACRDDILQYLSAKGVVPELCYEVMESARKGGIRSDGFRDGVLEELRRHGVPEWYIDSLAKVGYLFPKAHAVSYAVAAFRIAWYKMHQPLAFYAVLFAQHERFFDVTECCFADPGEGVEQMRRRIREIEESGCRQSLAYESLATLEISYEFYLRGFRFEPIDINRSEAASFLPVGDDALLPPFSAVPGISEETAMEIVLERKKCGGFEAEYDFSWRIKRLKARDVDLLTQLGAFSRL